MALEDCISALRDSVDALTDSVRALTAAHGGAPPHSVTVTVSEEAPTASKPAVKGKAAAPAPAPSEESKVGIADVRRAIQDAVEAGKRNDALAILEEFGASKLSELDAEHYAAVYARLTED